MNEISFPRQDKLKIKDANGQTYESEYTLKKDNEDGTIVLFDNDTKKEELWGITDSANSSAVVFFNGSPYEFISSVGLNEMTATGDVAGYSTPYAFSSRGDGNRKAAETVGYELVKKEVKDHNLLESKYHNFKKYPSKTSTKISLSLKEINSILRSASKLMNYNIKLKNEVGLDGDFWKRSSSDVGSILENIKNISRGVKMLTRGRLNEEQAPQLPTQSYPVSIDFSSFEKSLAKLVTKFENVIEGKVKGKTVRVRASKGFGQVEKEYEFQVASVSIVMFKEKYNIIFRGTNKKEYYLNPTFNVKITRSSDQPESPEAPLVSKDLNPPKTIQQVTK